MKKLIIIIALIGTTITANAQQKVSIGFRGGVNMANLRSDDINDNHFATGMNFVIPFDFNMHKALSLQPEIHFIQKGIAFDDVKISGKTLKSKVITNYIELPLLLKLKLGGENVKFYAAAGPSVGYALNRVEKIRFDGDKEKEKIDFDDSGYATDNRFDVGLAVGIGTEIELGRNALVLDVRYNHDFNDNIKFEDDAPQGHEKIHNLGLAFTVGYMKRF